MFRLLYDPVSEIKKAKRQSYVHIFLYLIAAALFETAGLLFFGWRFFSTLLNSSLIAYGIVVALFTLLIVHVVVAFFFTVAMHVLDGKGGYYEGLATLVLAMVAPAIATFFAGAAIFLPYGSGIAAILLSYGYILGTAALFRSGKELFELDYAGVLIGFLITALTLGLASFFFNFLR